MAKRLMLRPRTRQQLSNRMLSPAGLRPWPSRFCLLANLPLGNLRHWRSRCLRWLQTFLWACAAPYNYVGNFVPKSCNYRCVQTQGNQHLGRPGSISASILATQANFCDQQGLSALPARKPILWRRPLGEGKCFIAKSTSQETGGKMPSSKSPPGLVLGCVEREEKGVCSFYRVPLL